MIQRQIALVATRAHVYAVNYESGGSLAVVFWIRDVLVDTAVWRLYSM